MKVFIYTLEHPVTHEVRYVGKTKNPQMRFHNHMNKRHNENTHKSNWIQKLKAEKLRPIMKILDEVEETEWKFWERYWIIQLISWGFELTNHTSGGEGLTLGNQTSFQKGHKSWNKGTAKVKVLKGTQGKTDKNKENYFKSGFTPWNKGRTGYSTSRKGYTVPEEVRKKISLTLTGRESLKKRPVIQYTKNMVQINAFDSIKKASLQTGILYTTIVNCLNKRAKSAGGFIWL